MTEDLRIYDWEFRFQANIIGWISLDWQLLYNDIGSFEGHFPMDSKIVDVVLEHRYLVAVQGQKQAIIIGYAAGDDFVVYGRQVNWLLTRRIAHAAGAAVQTVEAYTRGLVASAFRDVSNFQLGALAGYTKQFEFAREQSAQLADVVTSALAQDGAGHNVVFDIKTKKWRYDVLRGEERAKILSPAYNAANLGVTYDMLDYFNAGYYDYQPPDDAEGNKPDKVETHITGSESGIYLFDTLLSGESEAEAKEALALCKANEKYTANVRNMQFGTDYNLGDTLKIQFEIGRAYRKTISKKVVGVNLSYGETYEEEPIFEGE